MQSCGILESVTGLLESSQGGRGVGGDGDSHWGVSEGGGVEGASGGFTNEKVVWRCGAIHLYRSES